MGSSATLMAARSMEQMKATAVQSTTSCAASAVSGASAARPGAPSDAPLGCRRCQRASAVRWSPPQAVCDARPCCCWASRRRGSATTFESASGCGARPASCDSSGGSCGSACFTVEPARRSCRVMGVQAGRRTPCGGRRGGCSAGLPRPLVLVPSPNGEGGEPSALACHARTLGLSTCSIERKLWKRGLRIS